MLDVKNISWAMLEHMRPRVSLAEGVRMTREQERRIAVSLLTPELVPIDVLWPKGRHAYVDVEHPRALFTVGASHRALAVPMPDCPHCEYRPRHAR